MGYWVWSTQRTCQFNFCFVNFLQWDVANPRTTKPLFKQFIVGCIVNFFVSYLICMFQDSVPAGSYNDPFLSSVRVCESVCVCFFSMLLFWWKVSRVPHLKQWSFRWPLVKGLVCLSIPSMPMHKNLAHVVMEQGFGISLAYRQQWGKGVYDARCVCVWESCVWKRACDKVVWERWCVWQSGVWKMVWRKMVCDKVVCERWCVWKLCVKERVWQSCVWKMVCVCVTKWCGERWCDKNVCERWCVTKWCERWCVKNGVCKMVCVCVTKLCERWCVKDGGWQSGVWKMVCDKVVWKMVCQRWWVTKWCVKDGVWLSGVKDCVSKMVCERWCVTKLCAKDVVWQRWRVTKIGSAPPEPAQCPKRQAFHTKRRWMSPSATPATQNEGRRHQVPRLPHLPHETKVDVAKCHACLAKLGGVTGDQARPSAQPEPAQCHKCHACHAKRRWVWPSATPATQNQGGCHQVPRLPRDTKVDVTKCYACHAKRRWMSPSATPATQNEGGCHQKVDVTKCYACHAKRRWMSPSATPATWNEGTCRQVPKMVCDKDGVWKMVCDKDGVTKIGWTKMVCDKDGMRKMVCDNDVWDKDGDQDGMWKVVGQRWCVTKLYVKDGVWQR